jgi:arginine/lysine/ornithine decarboxylase
MALVTYAHGEPEIDRLVHALRDLVDEHGDPGGETDVRPLPTRAELRTEQLMTPREAFFSASESVKPSDALGRISAELVTPYPPGIPVAAPGEVYNEAMIYYLGEIVAAGAFIEGAVDQSLDRLRVVAANGGAAPQTGHSTRP